MEAFCQLQLYHCIACTSTTVDLQVNAENECNGFHKHSKAVLTSTLTVGLLATVLSVVYSAVRVLDLLQLCSSLLVHPEGDGKPLLPLDKADDKEEKEKARPVTYSYAFFHVIFSVASMYSAMLLRGLVDLSGRLGDVGWQSVAALFIWSLVAPILFPYRELLDFIIGRPYSIMPCLVICKWWIECGYTKSSACCPVLSCAVLIFGSFQVQRT